MSRRTGLVQLVVAVAVGIAGGAAAVTVLDHERDTARAAYDAERDVDPGDRLGEALTALRDDGVYVAPDGRGLVDEAGERQLEAAVAAQPIPVYVVVWAPRPQIGLDGIALRDVLERQLPDEDSFVVVWEGPQEGDVIDLGPRGGSLDLLSGPSDFVGDAADTVSAAIAELDEGDLYSGSSGDDYWGGVPGGTVIGLFLGSAVLGTLLLAARLLAHRRGRRRLLPGGWRLEETG